MTGIIISGYPKDFFWGCDILAKGDFFTSMKDAETFLGVAKKKTKDFFSGIVFLISSNQHSQ